MAVRKERVLTIVRNRRNPIGRARRGRTANDCMCRESPWRMQSAEKASEGAAHDPVLVVSIELVDGGEIACDKVVQGVGMHDETCGEYARWGRVAPVCALAERGDIGVLGEERGACDGEGRIEERECGP